MMKPRYCRFSFGVLIKTWLRRCRWLTQNRFSRLLALQRIWNWQSALCIAHLLRGQQQQQQQQHPERAHRPTLVVSSRRSGVVDTGELGVGDEMVAVKANGEVDPVQAVEEGHLVQLVLHQLVLEVPNVFTAVTQGILHSSAPGSPMQLSSGAETRASREEVAQVVDRALLGSTSLMMSSFMQRTLQLHPSSSNSQMEPSLRKTEGALYESLLAGQRAYLEGTVTFPQ